MRYLLLIIAVALILYPIYAIIECLKSIGNLSNYGVGVLAGGVVLLLAGIVILTFTLKSFKQKKHD